MAFLLPTPTYSFIPLWKLTRSDNLSTEDFYVIPNVISLEWISSQIHSTREIWGFSGHNILSVFTGKPCFLHHLSSFWNPNSMLSLLACFIFNKNWGASIPLINCKKTTTKLLLSTVLSLLLWDFTYQMHREDARWSLGSYPYKVRTSSWPLLIANERKQCCTSPCKRECLWNSPPLFTCKFLILL